VIHRVVACAHANIALIKYWGKQTALGNLPATPSISLALDKLYTETIVTREEKGVDEFFLNDSPVEKTTKDRLLKYLNFWRSESLLDGTFSVHSSNNFPTGAGLASSSSGFAALATALGKFSNKKLNRSELSVLARRGSGSAARSIPGALAAFPVSANPSARRLLPPEKISWGMVIVVVNNAEKETGSSIGMELSRKTSPYYKSWIAQAHKDYQNILAVIKKDDFTKVGEITEANALAMHACMIATRPALVYWNGVTVDIIRSAKQWRENGLEVYATIDAGAHVALLARLDDLNKVAKKAKKIEGVEKAVICKPAGGSRVIKWE